jgi:hypothetical protein
MIDINAIAHKFLSDLTAKIEHGDEKHRIWLREEIMKWQDRLLEDMCTVSSAAVACEHMLDNQLDKGKP